MTSSDNANQKFLLKNGRQTIDYIFDAGLGLGFSIGEAVKCRFKAGIETDPAKQEKLMKACNWYIDGLARRTKMVREEIVAVVQSIVAKIEADKVSATVNQ